MGDDQHPAGRSRGLKAPAAKKGAAGSRRRPLQLNGYRAPGKGQDAPRCHRTGRETDRDNRVPCPSRIAITLISEPLSVTGRGHKLFELMCAHDLEGVVAKRLKDGYGSRVRWLKIKNPGYSQNEGRRELFDSWRA